ncbi:Glycine betaine-binding protein OpuAC [Lentibacillus sp. JNUCC-1]|uniref:glycine betaine ABC transporter substrate-binding protein n=1 Tax=Lentibacillus sp. JNUCC-1 TaxID=2654513 RepID=UPI0013240036|nr:glycine betaine ABC transporter substrate-binding protein [Lentibacillus sp. JNUCC-1]MUV37195.1 Glycine betaine-binding protein OpuAC [Lentibacillus sp. JNUCC-1]
MKNIRFSMALAAMLVLSLVLAACGGGNDDNASENNTKLADDAELGEKNITLPYVSWAGSTSRTPLLAAVLEDVGYNVDMKQVEAGPMWAAVADDPASFTATGWLPTTHQEYIEKYGDDVEVYDTSIIDKAPLALTVPSYMEDINSIEDLKGNEDLGEKVDWEITGIDPGAGIMQNTEKALEHYGLDKWSVQSSSEAAMLSELQKKIKNEEPVVVPLWKPHWIFAAEDLKMLEDPDEIYGGDGDHIDLVFNKEFKETSPAAYQIATQFAENYNSENEEELMGPIFVDDKDAEEVAQQYMKDNPDKVKTWQKGVIAE